MATNVTADSLLDRVKDITPIIREYAAEAEEKRRLSRPVVDAMLQAGLYSMSHPKAFGGLEVDPLTMFRVVEEVARHDSAAAWNLQLAMAADCFLAWLPDEGAAEIMHSHPSTIIATSFTPGRQATPVGGGYRLSGQWPFVSGGHDCHWVFFIPQIMDGDQPRLNDQGSPVQRFLYDTFQETYAAAVQGAEITLDQKLKMQLATSHAVMCAAKAVDLVHAAAGTSSIRNEHKFQKYFRDVHTITQHAFTSASRYESVGALMLGVESDWGFFAF